MYLNRHRLPAVCVVQICVALVALGLAGSASAKLTGVFTAFQQCPWDKAETFKCLHSVTESGEVVLGSKTVPIVNPVTLQGGFTLPSEATTFGKMIAAKDGETFSKTPQPIPGGLLGIVPPKGSSPLVKAATAFFFENELTGVDSTLELARPASEVLVSELHLGENENVALRIPVKIHLENPFLGSNCYIGSSSSPVYLRLTSGLTAPPAPNKPITGDAGDFEFLQGGLALRLKGAELVDNSFPAPKASGCGEFLSFLIDPIIDAQLGNTAAGHNTAILKNTIMLSSAEGVKTNDEGN